MQRVQISGSTLADIDGNGFYTFPINPLSFNNQDNNDYSAGRSIGGYSYEMVSQFDGRPKEMEWSNIPNSGDYITLIENLKALKNQSTFIKLRDLSGSEGSTDVQAIRVIDVQLQLAPGRGIKGAVSKLKYQTLKLVYVHTE